MKTTKKGVFTLQEIGARAFKAWPGRWKNEESAYASIRTAARRLEIGDINGKQKYKLIKATDVSRIIDELTRIDKKKRHESGQADFFDLIPEEPAVLKVDPAKITPELKKQIKDSLTGPAELLTIKHDPMGPDTLQRLETAAGLLQDALRVFCNCLIEVERGRE